MTVECLTDVHFLVCHSSAPVFPSVSLPRIRVMLVRERCIFCMLVLPLLVLLDFDGDPLSFGSA